METIRYYKYLIKPNLAQKKQIIRTFGAVRFVHNRFLEDLKSGKDMKRRAYKILEEYRTKYTFLNEIDGSALMNALFQAQDATDRLYRYRSRSDSMASYSSANLPRSPIKILNDRHIFIPKLGSVEIVYHRPLPQDATIRKVTIKRCPDGKYYASICVSIKTPTVTRPLNIENSIGIDYSSGHFYIDDQGNKIDMPHYYLEMQKRLIRQQQKLNRCVRHSQNYYKQKVRLAALYQREKNQRLDFLHKLSSRLADTYDIICMEDLDMQQISQGYGLGKRTYDNGFGEFERMLAYKMKERGKVLIHVDRYFPSSKTCNVCGSVNNKLTLKDRVWKCPDCGSILDRDVNAAINIRRRGIQDYLNRRASGKSLP